MSDSQGIKQEVSDPKGDVPTYGSVIDSRGRLVVPSRGLVIAFASVVVAVAALWVLPSPYCQYGGYLGVAGGWVGGARHLVDQHKAVKRFERWRASVDYGRNLR